MLRTNLILIEGIIGSGKSTTAERLCAELSGCGYPCSWYHEGADDNPIRRGFTLENWSEVVASFTSPRSGFVEWQEFVQARDGQEGITILESRFWQNTIMFMYVAGQSGCSVRESARSLAKVVTPLSPVLIHLDHSDIPTEVARTYRERPKRWVDWSISVWSQQALFKERCWEGYEGVAAFFEEWAVISRELYVDFPHRKIRVTDPHTDWHGTYEQIRSFLSCGKEACGEYEDASIPRIIGLTKAPPGDRQD